MGKGKRLTKEQLLYLHYVREREKKAAEQAPFSVQGILSNYTLWQCEKFGQKKLLEYNRCMRDKLVNTTDEELEEMRIRLANISEELMIRVESTQQEKKRSNDIVYNIALEIQENGNKADMFFQRYNILFFTYLYELGYRKKRLLRVRQYLVDLIFKAEKDGMLMKINQELIDEVGIYVQFMDKMPHELSDRDRIII